MWTCIATAVTATLLCSDSRPNPMGWLGCPHHPMGLEHKNFAVTSLQCKSTQTISVFHPAVENAMKSEKYSDIGFFSEAKSRFRILNFEQDGKLRHIFTSNRSVPFIFPMICRPARSHPMAQDPVLRADPRTATRSWTRWPRPSRWTWNSWGPGPGLQPSGRQPGPQARDPFAVPCCNPP